MKTVMPSAEDFAALRYAGGLGHCVATTRRSDRVCASGVTVGREIASEESDPVRALAMSLPDGDVLVFVRKRLGWRQCVFTVKERGEAIMLRNAIYRERAERKAARAAIAKAEGGEA